jgi:hypothetical protein
LSFHGILGNSFTVSLLSATGTARKALRNASLSPAFSVEQLLAPWRCDGRQKSRIENERGAQAGGRQSSPSGRRTGRRWSRQMAEHSDALTLEKGVFTSRDPKRTAASLKRSAEKSRPRKGSPFRSALSMLTFYINRAGKSLPASRRKNLMRAKDELRKQFGKA